MKITELYSKEKENFDFELATNNNKNKALNDSFYREKAKRIKSFRPNNQQSEQFKKEFLLVIKFIFNF